MKLNFKIFAAFIIALFGIGQTSNAQVTFTSWVHPPYISLYAAAAGAGVSTSSGINMDDLYSIKIPVGFTFNFYGTPNTQLLIGANGNINFDTSLAGNYDPWPITAALAGNSALYNSIAGPYCDMDQADYGGSITYFVTGMAPNRVFGANFCHNAMYTSLSCPGQSTTTQILLYENSNNVEVHLANKNVCTAWNSGRAIIGVQNATGSQSTAAPGRDMSPIWTATNEGWQFTPDAGDTTYSVSSIAYAPIPYYTIYWYDSSTGTYLGSGDSIVLTPSAVTTYIAYAVGCSDSLTSGFDTTATGHMTLMPLSVGGAVVPLQNEFTVYPNPANTVAYLVSKQPITDVIVTNPVGQVVYQTSCNTNKLQIDTKDLPVGMYYIKINGTVTKQFLKQ